MKKEIDERISLTWATITKLDAHIEAIEEGLKI